MGLTKPRAYQIFDIDYKQSVRVITLTNITLTGGAPSSVDGVNLSVGDRILVAGQSTGAQNGLYQVSVLGTGSDGTWIRSVDANQTGEVDAGMIVMVTEGEIYKDTQWKLTTNDPITIGVTALVFEQNSAFAFGNIFANGTAVLADIVGDTVTFTPANNLIITANATSDIITFSVSQSPDFTGNFVVSGTVGSNLIPSANIVYNLGNTTNRWNDIWLSNSTIYLGNAQISANTTSLILTTPEGAQTVFSGSTANISASTVTATGNVTGGNLITSGVLSVTGNANVGNIGANNANLTALTTSGNVTAGGISTTGNVSAAFFLGNVACASGIFTTKIFNGTSEANIGASDGNANITIGGVANVAVFSTAGANITGTLGVTGNITSGNVTGILLTGTLTTAAQPNVTSVGTLTSLTASGNVSGGNLVTTGTVSTGTLTASGNVTVAGNLTVSGNVISVNVTDLNVVDPIIGLGRGANNTPLTTNDGKDRGEQLWYYTTSEQSAFIGYDNSAGKLIAATNVSVSSEVVTVNNYGNLVIGGLESTTISATGNANVGNIDTAGVITATGNITGGNLNTGAQVVATGNVSGGNITTAGLVSAGTTVTATGNVSGGNLTTTGQITATGNITGGNLITSGLVSATGNIDGALIKASSNVEIQNRGILFLNDSDNSNYIGLRSPATLTGNFTYIFPSGYGNAAQVLTTNGAGGLTWEDQSGGGGGGATSFPNSTVQPVPGSTGNFDLSFNFVQTVQEIPFESTSTDPFGVNLGEVYSMMDPVGEVLEGVDLGVLT